MNIDTLTSDGIPATVLAIRAHDLDKLSALLALGVNHERVLGAHILRYIANYGGPRALRQISYFVTLWMTVADGRTDFPLRTYLDGGCSVYKEKIPEDEPEFPPIFASILGDNLATLWSLLNMGCSTSLTAESSSGFLAPIHVAANLRPLHLALLLHYGADPNLRTGDKSLWTALHIACVAHSIPQYLFPRVKMASLLKDGDRVLWIQLADYTDAKLFAVRLLVCGHGATSNAHD